MTEDAETFLAEHGFRCNILDATITTIQCRANCIRATEIYARIAVYGENEYRIENQLAATGLWDKGVDNGVIKCLGCPRYVPPSRDEVAKSGAGKMVKRYTDTEWGRVERKLTAYVFLHQERLNEEEYRYLSGTSPVSADSSKFRD